MRAYFWTFCLVFPLCLEAKNSKTIPLDAKDLKFSYQNFDGDLYVKCVHEIENDLSQDWKVTCENKTFKRVYSVHLWMTKYTKTEIPKSSYEILYWITERFPKNIGTSTTNWIHLKEDSQFFAASLSLGVDNESAGLYLDIQKN